MDDRCIAEIIGWEWVGPPSRWVPNTRGRRLTDATEPNVDDMALWIKAQGHLFRLEINEFGTKRYLLDLPRVRNLRARMIKADSVRECFEKAVRLIDRSSPHQESA